MILDQGIGAHHAQVETLGMGWAWTWVSGESPAADGTLYGWLEFSLDPSRLHFRVAGKQHFDTSAKLHFTPDSED